MHKYGPDDHVTSQGPGAHKYGPISVVVQMTTIEKSRDAGVHKYGPISSGMQTIMIETYHAPGSRNAKQATGCRCGGSFGATCGILSVTGDLLGPRCRVMKAVNPR